MDERAPLDRHSLQHTSKEPEAQVWAQIGTPQYNPTVRQDGESSNKPTSPLDSYKIPRLGSSSKMDETKKSSGDGRDEDSDVELEVDENAETILAENEPDTSANKETSSESKQAQNKGEGESRKEENASRTDDVPYTSSNDPKLIRARVFVGQLDTSKCTKKDLEKAFEPYGKLLGVLVLKGYGFIQYEDEECAMKAIKEAHGTEICGSKIACDRPLALKQMLRDERYRKSDSPDAFKRRERELLDELEYLRRTDYERYPPFSDLDPYYYHGHPPTRPPRDPYYDYPFERSLPPRPMDRYERLHMEEFERVRARDRYPPPPPRLGGYDRPRDDPYEERRHRDLYDHFMPPPHRRY